MKDLSLRALEQLEHVNPGLRRSGEPLLTFQQALVLQRYAYESELCDCAGLGSGQTALIAAQAKRTARANPDHPLCDRWRGA
jgi:hypothetical protein